MTCTLDPLNNPIHACRTLIQDVEVPYLLHDTDYLYFLRLQNNNPLRAAVMAAQSILFRFAQFSEEAIGPLSIKGGDAARSYRQTLQDFISNPHIGLNSALTARVFAGGISRQDIADNLANSDNYVPSTTASPNSQNQEEPSAYESPWPFAQNANRSSLYAFSF